MPEGTFSTILTLVILAGTLYFVYKVWLVASEVFESVSEWLFYSGSQTTLRRSLYLIIVTIFSAVIYYYSFYLWMTPCLLIPLIACWTLDDSGGRQIILRDTFLWFMKWTAISSGVITVLFYIFSDVSILEVGISGFFLALWEAIIDIGKFILSALGVLLLIGLYFSGGGGIFSGGGFVSETQSEEFRGQERDKADADRMAK